MSMILHERLSDDVRIGKVSNTAKCNLAKMHLIMGNETPCKIVGCKYCLAVSAKMIANRIDREYVARPRYLTGEAVKIGDRIQELDDNEVVRWEVDDYGSFTVYDNLDGEYSGEVLHKSVLDADGKPINVDDMLWSDDLSSEPREAVVTAIHEDGLIDVTWKDGVTSAKLEGKWFTHDNPDTPSQAIDDPVECRESGEAESDDATTVESFAEEDNMKKLLPERLRDYANRSAERGSYPTSIACVEHFWEEGFSGSPMEEERTLFTDWADEIERYYIPRPRFEDGEPVQFGDEARKHPRNLTHCMPESLEMLQDLINAIDNVYGSENEELHLQLDKADSICTALMERGA